jgi:hypothetical protein
MAAIDDIESFIAEVEAALGGFDDDRFADLLRSLYRSHDSKVIEVCNPACRVVRRKDVSVIDRMLDLRPLIAQAFGERK